MAMWPNPCVRVCVSVSRVPAGRMERESLPATRRVGVAAPLSVLREKYVLSHFRRDRFSLCDLFATWYLVLGSCVSR